MTQPDNLHKSGSPIWEKWLPLVLFLTAVYFTLFHHLDVQPLKNFDESLFGLRAFRLAYYGEYLNNFKEFTDGPSATNLKPPLISLIQAAAFKVLGYNELAMRLPIALSVVFMLYLMIRFSEKELGNRTYGYFSAMVLLTSIGFVRVHVARTGDHDAPLAVFGFMVLMYLYKYLQSDLKEKKYLIIITVGLICAVLTKSIAGLFFGPAMVIYALLERKLLPLVRDSKTWMALGVFIAIVGGYYLYREWEHSGFLKSVTLGELGGHYLKTRDGHKWPFLFYLTKLHKAKFATWLMFIPLGIGMTYFKPFTKLRSFITLMALATLGWWLTISFSQTKLEWYDASLYPPMAMMVGMAIYGMYQGLLNYLGPISNGRRYGLTALFVGMFFFYPYRAVFERTNDPKDIDNPGERYGYLIKQVERIFPEHTKFIMQYDGYSFHVLFYQEVYNQTKGYQINRKRKVQEVEPNEMVMTCQVGPLKYLRRNFEVCNITQKEGCFLVELGNPKHNFPDGYVPSTLTDSLD